MWQRLQDPGRLQADLDSSRHHVDRHHDVIASTSTTSVVPPTTAVTTAARPTATIEQLVEADGERVHVRCVGEGDTTVLLISGFGGDTTGWLTVEPAIATRTRVCAYDRPGTTFSTQATFASLFADEVAGLVLIDASPITWPAALCAVPDDGSEAAAILRGICTGTFPPAGNSEQLDVIAAFAEAAQIVSLGSLPVAVITATRREVPADLAASEVDRLNEAWNQGQQDWMALSLAAHLVSVDQTGHHIQLDQPGVVIDEITGLLP